MFKLVIFDWDGTLMDSCPRIISSVQTTAKKMGLNIPSDDDVKGIIGISLRPAIKILFPEAGDAVTEQIVEHYAQEYVHLSEVESPLFDGAQTLLDKLHGNNIQMAVATGKARRGLERVFEQTQTKHLFASSICADEAKSKPHPEMLQVLLARFGLQPSEAVFVGDTKHDLSMAKQINMPCIGVTHGAGSKTELLAHSPDYLADDLHQIKQFLQTTINLD